MVPAMTALAATPASPVRRLGFVYMPMGAHIAEWTPPRRRDARRAVADPQLARAGEGARHGASRNMELQNAYPGHARDVERRVPERRRRRSGPRARDYYLGTTVDQIAAQQIGQETQLPSLELAMDLLTDGRPVRQRLRVRLPEQSLVVVADDAAAGRGASAVVFERLFGDGGSSADRRAALRKNAQPARLGAATTSRGCRSKLGPADRAKVEPVSRHRARSRAAHPEGRSADARISPLPDLDRPVGVPAAYADHARLMFDLQVLALQGDVTRVITFQLARETSNRTYPEIGVPDPHHPLTHHGNDPEKIAKMAKINAFHVSLFA